MRHGPAFTPDTTEGFSDAELRVLNAAYERRWSDLVDDDTPEWGQDEADKRICDELTNAWYDGASVDGLLARVRAGV
jgi:hypothetical protein